MTNKIRFQTKLDYLADGVSNSISFNLFRSPLQHASGLGQVDSAFGYLANMFGGATELPSSMTASSTGVPFTPAPTVTLDKFGNVVVTFASVPLAGVQSLTLTMLF